MKTVAALIFLLFVSGAPAADEPTRFAADRPLDCRHIRLDLAVDVEGKRVAGTARLDLTALRDVRTVGLDARDLEVESVVVSRGGRGEEPVSFRNDGSRLEVALGDALVAGDVATVTVRYSVADPDAGLHFFGPGDGGPDVPHIVWSQGEAVESSYWFPCLDHPNERQTTELVVTASSRYRASSNGRLLSRQEGLDGTITWHWLQDKPHAAYLVSLVVGEFHVEQETWRGRPVEYWVRPLYADRIARSFRNTTRMLDFFSDVIGVEYPWDRYAQVCCYGFGGGMENTSATTMGERALHDERSILDSDSDGLIAHEMAHQWWGDLLTCRDWAHIWLNEGFATYFEAMWTEYDLGPDEFAYEMERNADQARRGGASRPIVDRAYEDPDSMFDSRAYPKGAWVLHMIRRRLGDELFGRVINRYATTFAYDTVETVDLRKTIEALTGRSFERFFYDWTERPGHPSMSVTTDWLADEGLAHVAVKQTQDAPAFHLPLTVEFRFEGERPPVTVTRDMTEKEISFHVPLPEKPGIVRVDPDQSILMELTETKGRDLWKAQLLEDPSVAGRVRAARHLAESRREADTRILAEALRSEPFWGVRVEIAGALGKAGGPVAREALIEGLREQHPRVRGACVQQLESFTGDGAVIAALRDLVAPGDPSYGVESAAIEAYAACRPEDGLALLKQALHRASRNEVIRSSALAGLGRLGDPEAVAILCEWTRPQYPREARPAAIQALARHTRENRVDEGMYATIVAALQEALRDTGRRVRGAAIDALGRLGEPARAREAVPALRAIAANDAEFRLRQSAKRSIEAIEKGEPAQVQVDELRKELRELADRNEELAARLEKLEGRGDGNGRSAEE
jgi:aminopeptidase N